MAGFCVTLKTEYVRYNVCNYKGMFSYSYKHPFVVPENLYGFVLGYETGDSDLKKIKLISPYKYDESIRDKEVPVKAMICSSHLNRDYKARFEGETDEMFEERIREAGDVALTEGEHIARNSMRSGVMAKMMYLEDLPDDKAELQKIQEVIQSIRLSWLMTINGLRLPNMKVNMNGSNLKKFINQIKEDNEYWFEKLDSIKSPMDKIYYRKDFDVFVSLENLIQIIESYYDKDNGIDVWKRIIEKKLKN